jgi:hypothetical protein
VPRTGPYPVPSVRFLAAHWRGGAIGDSRMDRKEIKRRLREANNTNVESLVVTIVLVILLLVVILFGSLIVR